MKSTVVVLSVILACGLFLSVEAASKCYSCTLCSENNPTSDPAIDCPNSSYYCQKTVAQVLGNKVITKGCVSQCTSNTASAFGTGVKVRCCSGDLCNSSSAKSYSLFALLGSAVWALLAIMKF